MSIEKVRGFFSVHNMENQILEFPVSSATVALAAQALGTEECRIAKTLAFDVKGETVLVVAAGNTKIDNSKFKGQFSTKAKMLPFDQAEARIGHAPGGVCPFAVNQGVAVYLDTSLQAYSTVYPACGSSNSAIQLTCQQLEELSGYLQWVDVCKV